MQDDNVARRAKRMLVTGVIGSDTLGFRPPTIDYLADVGVLARSLRQRSAGRPEALYRPVVPAG